MIKWVKCPYCDKNLCKTDMEPDATIHEIILYLWCKKCKKEVKVNIK